MSPVGQFVCLHPFHFSAYESTRTGDELRIESLPSSTRRALSDQHPFMRLSLPRFFPYTDQFYLMIEAVEDH